MDWDNIRYLLEEFHFYSLIDVLIVSGLIYLALAQIRGTRSMLVLRGLSIFAIFILFLSLIPKLQAVRWLATTALPALIVAIPVIFQSEIRRVFAKLGQAGGLLQYFRPKRVNDELISELSEACRRLSAKRHGALIVLERETGLQEYIDTGVILDAKLSEPLLLSIFHKDAELHDGGIIIRDGRIAAATCVMPLSNSRMSDQMGLRHRASLGTSEVSDALVIIVSEETGHIAFAHNGVILPRQPQQQLPSLLRAFLQKGDEKSK